jgi:hypothetical protein
MSILYRGYLLVKMPGRPAMVTAERLAKLIASGEGQCIEFKRSLGLHKEALESLVAMINAEAGSGTVIFGVDDDGTIRGVEPGNLDTAQRSLIEQIRVRYDPALAVQSTIIQIDGKSLVVLSAERWRGTSYHEYDGRAYLREGTTNRQLSVAEKQVLTKRRSRENHTGPWRCDQCGAFTASFRQSSLRTKARSGRSRTVVAGNDGRHEFG